MEQSLDISVAATLNGAVANWDKDLPEAKRLLEEIIFQFQRLCRGRGEMLDLAWHFYWHHRKVPVGIIVILLNN